MQVTLIHNPGSGDEEISSEQLFTLIRNAGHDVVYQSTREDNWDTALKNPGDWVAVAGGDGTVGKVAKRLVSRSIPIAVLPLGTANNIAKTLKLADTPLDRLINSWTTARTIPFDGAIVSGAWGTTYYIESFGIGLFANTMLKAAKSDAMEQYSAQEEIVAALQMLQENLQNYPAKGLDIRLDGQGFSGEYIGVEVMNIASVGSNLYLAPNANPGDGLLDVVLLTKDDRHKLDEYLSRRLAGKQQPPPLTIHRGKQIQIQGEAFDIHIDDEMRSSSDLSAFATSAVIDIKIDPHVLTFLVA
jgi:diacylglycerol kinase (ATP)